MNLFATSSGAIFSLILFAFSSLPANAQASGFATDAPTMVPYDAPRNPNAGATPVPTLANEPPVIASQYAPYLRPGSASVVGKITARFKGAGDDGPPDGYPIYLIPATPYTQWYIGLHVLEFMDLKSREPVIHHGGLLGLHERMGFGYTPDYAKPVPFTTMSPVAFHSVRVTRTAHDGAFDFTGVPSGKYLILTHWPLKFTSETAHTIGYGGGYFGGLVDADTTFSHSALFVLMTFVEDEPIDVRSHVVTVVKQTNHNSEMFWARCAPYGCRWFDIEQWLSTDERDLTP